MSALTAPPAVLPVGDLLLAQLSDGITAGARGYWFTGAQPAQWMPEVGVTTPEAPLPVTYGGFVITGDDHVTLVDVGWGHAALRMSDLRGPAQMLAGLAALGIAPGDVDQVVQTHLHTDHCGWLVADDEGTLTFPNAAVYVHERELAYWRGDEVAGRPFNQSTAPTVRQRIDAVAGAGLLRPFAGPLVLSDAVWVMPTPGHTPGHVSVVAGDGGQTAIIAGDLAHHPVHLRQHGWLPSVDVDPARSVVSRGELTRYAAEHHAMVLAPHFPMSTVVDVIASPDGSTQTRVRSTAS